MGTAKVNLNVEEGVNVKVNHINKEQVADEVKTRGTVHVKIYRAIEGKWYDHYVGPNLVTNTGRDLISFGIGTASAGNSDYIALSASAVTHSVGSTTLDSEITLGGLERVEATFSHTAGADTYSLSNTFTATTDYTDVQQGGTFDAASNGRMAFVSTFSSASLNNADQLAITWYVKVV